MYATDKPGAIASVTKILADRDISIDAVMQKEQPSDAAETDIVFLTNKTVEKNMNAAITEIEALVAVTGNVIKLRMETLG